MSPRFSSRDIPELLLVTSVAATVVATVGLLVAVVVDAVDDADDQQTLLCSDQRDVIIDDRDCDPDSPASGNTFVHIVDGSYPDSYKPGTQVAYPSTKVSSRDIALRDSHGVPKKIEPLKRVIQRGGFGVPGGKGVSSGS